MKKRNGREGRVKPFRRGILFLCVLMLLLPCAATAANDGFSTSYTYNFNYWGDVQESPDAYRVLTVVDSMTLGMDRLDNIRISRPQTLFARGQELYICDTGNNRILQLHRDGDNFSLARLITGVNNSSTPTFDTPTDVFADGKGNLYVADSGHGRIVMMDRDLNWVRDYTKPTDSTFDQSSEFIPHKVVADVAGPVYCLVRNVNKGIAKFEADGSFSGFIGANKVSVSMADYIWKRFFQSKTQREQSEAFVPTEYENIAIDGEGFIYATNTSFSEGDLMWDKAKPIRRINSLGNDILIKNDRYPPIGELYWVEGSQAYGPSRLADVTVLENDNYVAVDRFRGRLFGYDAQGIMLWAFGTKGNVDGAFSYAISVEHMGRDLVVLDQNENSVTVFEPTEYGNLIYDAQELYLNGDYNGSADKWFEVLKMNAGYPMAFRGVGRSLLRQNRFEEAMEYFRLAHDRSNYGRAFKLYRKEWVEKNIWWIVLCLAVLLIVPLGIGRAKRMKGEVIMHEHSKVRK